MKSVFTRAGDKGVLPVGNTKMEGNHSDIKILGMYIEFLVNINKYAET